MLRLRTATVITAIPVILSLSSGFRLTAGAEQTPTSQIYTNGETLLSSLLLPLSVDQKEAKCYASYFRPGVFFGEHQYVLILTPAHCLGAAPNLNFYIDVPGRGWKLMEPVAFLRRPGGSLPDLFFGQIREERPHPLYFKTENCQPLSAKDGIFFTVATPARVGKIPEAQKLEFVGRTSDDLLEFWAEKPIELGSSGAPVVTKDGCLAGMLVMRDPFITQRGYAMPIDKIMEIYDRYIKY